MRLVYIAGPYRAPTPWGVRCNIRNAEDLAAKVHAAGMFAVCPHANAAHMEGAGGIDDAHMLVGTLELMRRCDAVILTPNWRSSAGATRVCTFSRKRYGAASAIYKAASSHAGASPIITYTLASEAGVSLAAAEWHDEGIAGGGKWNRGCVTPDHLAGKKRRWCDRLRQK